MQAPSVHMRCPFCTHPVGVGAPEGPAGACGAAVWPLHHTPVTCGPQCWWRQQQWALLPHGPGVCA